MDDEDEQDQPDKKKAKSSSSSSSHPTESTSENKRSGSKQSSISEPEPKGTRNSTDDACNVEVCEFYSPPRVVPKVLGKEIKKGLHFDLSCPDQNGNRWNFSNSNDREKASKYVQTNKPMWILGCPPWDPSSIMNNLNQSKGDLIEKQRKLIEAQIHLDFCAELDTMQIDGIDITYMNIRLLLVHRKHQVSNLLLLIIIILQLKSICAHME